MTPDVVITGRGVVTSIGEGADAFLDALCDAPRPASPTASAPCAEFDPEVAMTPKEARRADRFAQLAVAAADQAVAEAGLPDGIEPERARRRHGHRRRRPRDARARDASTGSRSGDRAVSPLFVPMMMPNAAAGLIAMRLGAHGPGFSRRLARARPAATRSARRRG